MATDRPSPPASAGLDQPVTDLTIGSIDATAQRWRAQLESGDATIDLGAVTACDAIGVQLLCSGRRSAIEARRTLRFDPVAELVRRTATELGCEFVFRATEVQP